jgi:hypothetical protein
MRKDYSGIDFLPISGGAHGDLDNIKGTKHMQQVGAVADRLEKQKTAVDAAPQGGGSGYDRVEEAQGRVAGIRKLSLDTRLKDAMQGAAEEAGVKIRVTSGGQDPHGPRTGSHRHDYGRAADVDIMDEQGHVLSRNDSRRVAFIEAAAKRGAGGTGAGYMDDPLKVHVGITGSKAVVGEGLGAYAGNPAERAAVSRGLKNYDPDLVRKEREARAGGTPKSVKTDRIVLDKASANELKMKTEGAGKLAVSVDAPAGTKVEASAEGPMFAGGVSVDRHVTSATGVGHN